jgi:hypothetical protein
LESTQGGGEMGCETPYSHYHQTRIIHIPFCRKVTTALSLPMYCLQQFRINSPRYVRYDKGCYAEIMQQMDKGPK